MKKLLYTIFLLVLSSPLISGATELDDIVTEQNRVIQNQQQFEQNKLRQNELKAVEVEQKKIKQQENEVIKNLADIKCFQIRKISFTKNKIFSPAEEKSFIKNYVNQCLTLGQINELTQEISNDLAKKGYATSKAILTKEEASGELLIEIVEGYMEDLIFNDESFFDKTQKFSAFGIVKKDEILNLHNIEPGLEQVNRLSSNKAVIKVFAGAKKNSSIVAVQNKPQNTIRANIAFDDLGSKTTGKHRDTIGMSFDNLLHLNDNFNVSRSANDLTKKKEEGANSSLNFSWSLPLKNNTLTLSSTRYHYSLRQGSVASIKAHGESITDSITFDSKLIKKARYRLNSSFNLAERNVVNYTDDVKLEASSRRSSIGSFSLANSFFFNASTLFVKPSYSRGLKVLNAKKDDVNMPSQAGHAQFEAFKLYANYSHNLEMPRTHIPLTYSLTFDSQFSRQRLYSSDQFFIGGPYTVRGFENGSIAGDSGYTIKNEVKFNVGKTVAQLANVEKLKYFPQWLNKVSIAPFYDYGNVRTKDGVQSGRLSGAGFKTSFNHKNLTANLTCAWVNNKSELLQDKYRENQAVYFDVTTELGFF